MKTVETVKKMEPAFDLRGLLAECVKGNAQWLKRVGGSVRTPAVTRPGVLASVMPHSER